MHIVAALSWQKDEAAVAGTIAGIQGILVYEARQRIAGGGPAVLACLADPRQAATLAERLSRAGVPALVIDREEVRRQRQPFRVCHFRLEGEALWVESLEGDSCTLAYGSIELLLVATCNVQGQSTTTVTERKFSLGKTLLAGGVPMSKKVTREVTVSSNERDETLWLYAQDRAPLIFDRSALNYEGLGSALQLSRDLNFVHLRKELRRLAPQACNDERLLNRAGLLRLLGSVLSPEVDLDLAFEILARALWKHPEEAVVSGKMS